MIAIIAYFFIGFVLAVFLRWCDPNMDVAGCKLPWKTFPDSAGIVCFWPVSFTMAVLFRACFWVNKSIPDPVILASDLLLWLEKRGEKK